MVKQLIPALAIIIFLSSCSSLKPLGFISNRQEASVNPVVSNSETSRFIEDIAVMPVSQPIEKEEALLVPEKRNFPVYTSKAKPEITISADSHKSITEYLNSRATVQIETASPVQFKYAVLMNTEVELLPDASLLEAVDDWYGVRYRSGGNTKSGVDCSGFTVAVYSALYGIMLPRVSRDQYSLSRKISTTELQEGDLLFFNTTGRGVSHVGIYLGNNKFVHASVSRGVMVNDLFETYYLKRFIGAGRIDNKEIMASNRGR